MSRTSKCARMPRGAQREATLCGGCAGRVLITETSPTAACTPAQKCIEGVNAEHVLADKGYDRDAIVIQAAAQEMNSLLPSKKNRKVQRPLNQDTYKLLRNSVCLSSPQKMKGREPPAMQKTQYHSLLLFTSDALRYGLLSRGDTVYTV